MKFILYRTNKNSICVCATVVLDSISLHGSGVIEKAKLSTVSLGILNMTLPIIWLIHICLYQSVLVEEIQIPLYLWEMKNDL